MIVLSDIWVNFREVDHRFSHIFLQSAARYVRHVFPCKFVYLFGRVLSLFRTYKPSVMYYLAAFVCILRSVRCVTVLT